MKSKVKKAIVSFLTAAIASMSLSSVMTASASGLDKTFRIYYSVASNSGVASMSSNLKYDYSKVEVKKVIRGNLGGSHGFSQTEYGDMDVIYRNTGNLNAAGVLMFVSFDAPSNATKLSDYASYKITSVKNSAGVSLSNNKVTMETVLVGDILGDGEVKNNDLLALNNYLNGNLVLEGSALKAADINGDLNVNNADYELLRKYILGTADIDY